jgi:hypothetical protein
MRVNDRTQTRPSSAVSTFAVPVDMATQWTRLFATGREPVIDTFFVKRVMTHGQYPLVCLQRTETDRTVVDRIELFDSFVRRRRRQWRRC